MERDGELLEKMALVAKVDVQDLGTKMPPGRIGKNDQIVMATADEGLWPVSEDMINGQGGHDGDGGQ